jgi:hypothetical protein
VTATASGTTCRRKERIRAASQCKREADDVVWQ